MVVSKWTHIRDAWTKALKKHKDQKTSGSSTKPSRLYVYHEQMSFLKKVTNPSVVHQSTHTDNSANETITEVDVNTDKDPSKQTANKATRRKRNINEVDAKMMKFIDHQIISSKISKHNEDDNRHLLFFKGILPSLTSFDDDETLEFQAGVLGLVQNMRARKKTLFRNSGPSLTPANYPNWHHQGYSEAQIIPTVAQPMTSPYDSQPSPSSYSLSSTESSTQHSLLDLDISNF